jgi:formylglycine-generating enzyme required for sulfatase activity
MINVEGGPFSVRAMLHPDSESVTILDKTESPTANLTNFKISKTEITQAQFEHIMGVNPAYYKSGNTSKNIYAAKGNETATLPVENVNWYAALAYCNKLSIKEGKTPCYTVHAVKDWKNLDYESIPTDFNDEWNAVECDFSKNGYRLPTASEWAYAACGGKNTQGNLYAGMNNICLIGWYAGNNEKNDDCAAPCKGIYGPKPVAMKYPNELGLYDMTGNVWEWCWNWENETFPQNTPSGKAQFDYSSSANRVARGGSYATTMYNCLIFSSDGDSDPGKKSDSRGFRVACNEK